MMNIQLLNEAEIDYEKGVKTFLGNNEIYEKYLKRFPGDTTFSRLCAEMESKNFEAAFRSAHSLKGLCGNLAMTEFFGILVEFVDKLRDAADIDGAERIFPKLKASYSRVIAAIENAGRELI